MRRRLYLIINDGGMSNYLPNVKTDKDNYLRFFQSPEGGAWDDNEIELFENNFYFNRFENHINYLRHLGQPYDFLLIVFCGHGYSENGERFIEVRPEGECISLSQIQDVCHRIRTLLITDSCLAIEGGLNEVRGINGIRTFSGDAEYRELCKDIYNSAVMQTSEYSFTVGSAVSIGESAGEDEHGGKYSQILLKTAIDIIEVLKTDPKHVNDNYASFSYIHDIATNRVISLTKGRQHPTIQMSRSYHQLPFVVVAK